jgi:hypothetical protein
MKKAYEVMGDNAHVFLGANPLQFDTEHSSLYFDRCNRQIVTTHGKEVRRISLRRDRDTVKISHIGLAFVIDSFIVKFSLDHTFLALVKSHQQVDFINLETQVLLSQRCKRTNAKLLDFFWTGPDTFFFVTTNGFELYQFSSSKKSTKLLKELKMPVRWFSYSSKLLVLATGSLQSTIYAFFFKGTSIIKIPKFELDTSGPGANNKLVTKEKQVTICRLYDKVCCIHHQVSKRQLHLYQMNRESVTLSTVIDLHTEGKVVVHVVDNLLVCHNIQKKISSIFDIREEESFVAAPLPMVVEDVHIKSEEIYGNDWIYCPTNYVIVPSKGLLCEVKVNLCLRVHFGLRASGHSDQLWCRRCSGASSPRLRVLCSFLLSSPSVCRDTQSTDGHLGRRHP